MTRRTLFLLVLGAALLLVGALVGVLALASTPEDDAGPAVVRPDFQLSAPVLPTPVEPVLIATAPQPVRPEKLVVGPNVIIGRVIDEETLKPVTAYTVKAMPHGDTPAIERLAQTPGNPEPVRAVAGVFRLAREPGRWDVVVQAAGYLPGELADVELPRPDGKPLELKLSHGPSITGVVFDDSNLGVMDVPVFLRVDKLVSGLPPRNCVARTDAEGRFRFSPLPPGMYSVFALEPTSDDRVLDIALDRGTAEVALYVAPRHQLVAAVRDIDGRPVEDAEVELRAEGAIVAGKTNASGQAQLRYVKPGRYAVRVSREGYTDVKDTLDLTAYSGEAIRWYTLAPAP